MDHSIYIFGMKFPNRIFVGGLTKTVEAKELADFFETFGVVTEAKVIMNARNGLSKGYGFITFATSKDVDNVIAQGQLFFCGRKLNLGPAVRKQVPDMTGEPVMVINTQWNNGAARSPPTPVVTTHKDTTPLIQVRSPPPRYIYPNHVMSYPVQQQAFFKY